MHYGLKAAQSLASNYRTLMVVGKAVSSAHHTTPIGMIKLSHLRLELQDQVEVSPS
jgi:hypothetical protein